MGEIAAVQGAGGGGEGLGGRAGFPLFMQPFQDPFEKAV